MCYEVEQNKSQDNFFVEVWWASLMAFYILSLASFAISITTEPHYALPSYFRIYEDSHVSQIQ